MPNPISIAFLVLFAPPATPPGGAGLTGLGPPGVGLRVATAPQAVACENEIVTELNRLRAKEKQSALTVDERARRFSRDQAEWGAKGDPRAKQAADQVRSLGLAPHGYYLQFSFGERGRVALASLLRDAAVRRELLSDYAQIGVGAFWVPEDKPYCQVALLLVRVPDPRAGQPGLSASETDPVMNAAATRIQRECYNSALATNPNLRGKLLFQLTIKGDGSVGDVKLLEKLGSILMEGCAVQVVSSLRFPAPYKGKPVVLNHPMLFVPPQGEQRVGRLTDTEIQTTFSAAAARFRACYEDARREKPMLRGRVTLAVTVATDGSVKQAEPRDNGLDDDALTRCVLVVAKGLRFPRPQFDGEVAVTYPLSFAPPTGGPRKP